MGDNQTAVLAPAVMQSIGLDLYNGNITGDIAATITASSGKADKAWTLDTSGGNPACNQGGIAVAEAKITKTIGIATQSYYDMQISDKGATLRAAGGAYGGQ